MSLEKEQADKFTKKTDENENDIAPFETNIKDEIFERTYNVSETNSTTNVTTFELKTVATENVTILNVTDPVPQGPDGNYGDHGIWKKSIWHRHDDVYTELESGIHHVLNPKDYNTTLQESGELGPIYLRNTTHVDLKSTEVSDIYNETIRWELSNKTANKTGHIIANETDYGPDAYHGMHGNWPDPILHRHSPDVYTETESQYHHQFSSGSDALVDILNNHSSDSNITYESSKYSESYDKQPPETDAVYNAAHQNSTNVEFGVLAFNGTEWVPVDDSTVDVEDDKTTEVKI